MIRLLIFLLAAGFEDGYTHLLQRFFSHLVAAIVLLYSRHKSWLPKGFPHSAPASKLS